MAAPAPPIRSPTFAIELLNNFINTMKKFLLVGSLLVIPLLVSGSTNINSTNAFSWSANAGFVHSRGDVTNGGVIGEYVLGGFIYGANAGWVNLWRSKRANAIQS